MHKLPCSSCCSTTQPCAGVISICAACQAGSYECLLAQAAQVQLTPEQQQQYMAQLSQQQALQRLQMMQQYAGQQQALAGAQAQAQAHPQVTLVSGVQYITLHADAKCLDTGQQQALGWAAQDNASAGTAAGNTYALTPPVRHDQGWCPERCHKKKGQQQALAGAVQGLQDKHTRYCGDAPVPANWRAVLDLRLSAKPK